MVNRPRWHADALSLLLYLDRVGVATYSELTEFAEQLQVCRFPSTTMKMTIRGWIVGDRGLCAITASGRRVVERGLKAGHGTDVDVYDDEAPPEVTEVAI